MMYRRAGQEIYLHHHFHFARISSFFEDLSSVDNFIEGLDSQAGSDVMDSVTVLGRNLGKCTKLQSLQSRSMPRVEECSHAQRTDCERGNGSHVEFKSIPTTSARAQ